MSAKNATLHHTGSHWVEDGRTPEGISKVEVYLYYEATWRGKPVTVTMQADRYEVSSYDQRTDESTRRLTDWRVYAQEARYGNAGERVGNESVTGTARSALSKLCEPLAMEWLDSAEYVASYQRAVARMIMRHFDDRYSAVNRVTEALSKFAWLSPSVAQALKAALDARVAYDECLRGAFAVIDEAN